jgi:hypothetical protein
MNNVFQPSQTKDKVMPSMADCQMILSTKRKTLHRGNLRAGFSLFLNNFTNRRKRE